MKSRDVTWTVGETARRFGLATHVLRHWEDVGLLRPDRDGAGRRRYGRDDVVRVAVVIRSKAAGMSLDQILVLLDAEARDRHQVLHAHVDDLDRRMAEMQRSRAMTLHALECRAHDIAACPHFARNVEDLLDGTTTWPLDVAGHAGHAGAAGPQVGGNPSVPQSPGRA